MNFPTTVLLVLALFAAQQSFAEDLDAAWPWARIAEGDDAQDNKFPYQVALLDNGTFYCGGVILTSNYIVTSDFCLFAVKSKFHDGIKYAEYLEQRMASTLSVRVGSTSTREGGQVIAVSHYIRHPDINNFGDIALLRLSSPLILDTENVAAIPIATSPPPENSPITIVGWGETSIMGPLYDHLQTSKANVVGKTQCPRPENNIICVQGNNLNTACPGDCGGAAIYEGTLVGVVTLVYGKCYAVEPFEITSFPAYIDWIKENTDL